MATASLIPATIRAAYEALKAANICTVTRALESGEASCTFQLAFNIADPNTENLPGTIELRVVIPHAFPFDTITFFPVGDELQGFPHQETESGKLCLPSDTKAPFDSSRLVQLVQWAHEWVQDAANGTLLKPGEPYELPDFRLEKGNPYNNLPPVPFAESGTTFPTWEPRIGQSGTVQFAKCKDAGAILALKFSADDGTMLSTPTFTPELTSKVHTFLGSWILLPRITVVRHRPPKSYEELFRLCGSLGVKIVRPLRRAWAIGNRNEHFGLLLIGFPIPRVVGGPFSEVHWQPIAFPTQEKLKRSFHRKGKADEGRLWNEETAGGCFKPSKPILWAKSTNVDHSRQYARGEIPAPAKDLAIAIVGCGALGSFIAEALARSGVRRLLLIDRDIVEYGNLARHSLDGRHVGDTKATALAHRLASANPLTRITGHPGKVPPSDRPTDDTRRALEQADVLIDCSTDHGAFLWLSRFARSSHKRLASLFIDAHATLLTLALSGRHTSCNRAFERLKSAIAEGRTPVSAQEYFGEPPEGEIVILGAGCWHPTFPAFNRHIWQVGCSAVDLLLSWLQRPYRCDGCGILVRRLETEKGPAIDILWNEPYR
jgi:molybdopterin/thiamine biosynthesis adenylyltransferase